MLQQMRTFAKSWVASVFLLVVVGSFTLWGVADVFRGRTDTDVVSMRPAPIPYDVFVRDYRNVIRNESIRSGREITSDEARKIRPGQAGGRADDQPHGARQADQRSRPHGERRRRRRARAPDRSLQGPLGVFDRQTFERLLQQRGYGEAEFIESMRSDMARDQLLTPVASDFTLPPGYAHALFAFATEERAVEYVLLTAQVLGPAPVPDDKTLAAYIKAHPERFSTPEYRSVTVASLTVEDVSAGVQPTEAQLKSEYERQKSTYIVPEKRDVQQITFNDEAGANAARAKVEGGMSFEMAAAGAGKTIDDRKDVSEDDLGTLGKPVFALELSAVSAPLKNFTSWVLMRVTKISPGKSVSYEQAKPDLTKAVTEQIANGKLVDVANRLSGSGRRWRRDRGRGQEGRHASRPRRRRRRPGPDARRHQGAAARRCRPARAHLRRRRGRSGRSVHHHERPDLRHRGRGRHAARISKSLEMARAEATRV